MNHNKSLIRARAAAVVESPGGPELIDIGHVFHSASARTCVWVSDFGGCH